MRTKWIQVGVWLVVGGGGMGWAAALPGQTPGAAAGAWSPAQPLTGQAVPCRDGRSQIFTCKDVDLLAYLPPSAMGGAGGSDLWGWTDSVTHREFALVAGSEGTAFVEVTDPVRPQYLGTLPFRDSPAAAADIKVYKNYAFIVVEGTSAGLQVFDLTQLRDVKSAPTTFQETAHYAKFGNAHNLVLNPATGFAYAVGSLGFLRQGRATIGADDGGPESCNHGLHLGGLHMIDVRDPTHPTFAGCYTDPLMGAPLQGYIHDAQCVIYHGPDQAHRGREICLYATGTGLGIVDVTDKQHPQRLSAVTYPNLGYTHQGWLTEDQRYFFLDDEADETGGGIGHTRTLVFDVSDLDDPVVTKEYYATTQATDHNLFIRGQYMYQANYEAGLRVVDVSDPKNPAEVGFFDTVPQSDRPGMTGGSAFGVYPYFREDGVVAVTSGGLFLLRRRP